MTYFSAKMYRIEATMTVPVDTITKRLDSFKDDIALDIIQRAKLIYQICRIGNFEVEVYPNDDATISLLAMHDNYSLEIEVGEGKLLPTRYQIGKGLNFHVIWRNRLIHQNELGCILSQIRLECERATLSETLISTTTIDGATTPLPLDKYFGNSKEEFQSSIRNVLTT